MPPQWTDLSTRAVFRVGPHRFALTPVGVGLRTDVPGSLRPAVLLLLDESHWRPWGYLLHTVRSGETAFHHAHGAAPLDWRPPTPACRYNLVVIGGGAAGLVTAAGAAGLGARVALVERGLLGGAVCELADEGVGRIDRRGEQGFPSSGRNSCKDRGQGNCAPLPRLA